MNRKKSKFSNKNKLISPILFMILLLVTIVISLSSVSAANEICTDISVDPIRNIEPGVPFNVSGRLYDSANPKTGIKDQEIIVKISAADLDYPRLLLTKNTTTDSNGKFTVNFTNFLYQNGNPLYSLVELNVEIIYAGNNSINTSPTTVNKAIGFTKITTFFVDTYVTKEGFIGGKLVDEFGKPLSGKTISLRGTDCNGKTIGLYEDVLVEKNGTWVTEKKFVRYYDVITGEDGSFNFTDLINISISKESNLYFYFSGGSTPIPYYEARQNLYLTTEDMFSIVINPIQNVLNHETLIISGTLYNHGLNSFNSNVIELWFKYNFIKNITITKVNNNIATFTINMSNFGNSGVLTLKYYQSTSIFTELKVEFDSHRIPTFIELDNLTNISLNKENTISGKLYDSDGVGIYNKAVAIYIDGVFIEDVITQKDGTFKITNYTPIKEGNHTITVCFSKPPRSIIVVMALSGRERDSYYAYFNKTVQFNVAGSPPPNEVNNTTITVNNISVYTTESFTIKGILLDKNNQPIANAIVYIYLNGTLYGNATTNSTGHYTYTNLINKGSVYNIKVKYPALGINEACEADGVLTIKRTPTNLTVEIAKNLTIGKLTTIVAILKDTYNNKVIAGANVQLLIDGVSVESKTTDADGKVSFDFTPKQQKHIITLIYLGNETYADSKSLATIESLNIEIPITPGNDTPGNNTPREDPPGNDPPNDVPPGIDTPNPQPGIDMLNTGNPISIIILCLFSIALVQMRKKK